MKFVFVKVGLRFILGIDRLRLRLIRFRVGEKSLIKEIRYFYFIY